MDCGREESGFCEGLREILIVSKVEREISIHIHEFV